MWKIEFARDSDYLFIENLNDESFDEIADKLKEVTETFDNLNSSVMCTSVILSVESYHVDNDHLFVNYHIDSDEKVIRITSIDLT